MMNSNLPEVRDYESSEDRDYVSSDEDLDSGWKPVEDLNKPYVTEDAEFALMEYNGKGNSNLVLVKVTEGSYSNVGGVLTKFVIEAKDDATGKIGSYEFVVFDRPWLKIKVLESFKEVLSVPMRLSFSSQFCRL